MTKPRLTADPAIVRVLVALGPDLTAREWAERLDVSLDEILAATQQSPYACVKPEPPIPPTTLRRYDQAAAIVEAIEQGHSVTKAVAAYTGLHPQTVRSKLTLLEAQGVVFRCGSGAKLRWIAK